MPVLAVATLRVARPRWPGHILSRLGFPPRELRRCREPQQGLGSCQQRSGRQVRGPGPASAPPGFGLKFSSAVRARRGRAGDGSTLGIVVIRQRLAGALAPIAACLGRAKRVGTGASRGASAAEPRRTPQAPFQRRSKCLARRGARTRLGRGNRSATGRRAHGDPADPHHMAQAHALTRDASDREQC